MTDPIKIEKVDSDSMTSDELKAILGKQKPVLVPLDESEFASVYDPTQEIVERLDRIAAALEESAAMVREEFRAKGYAIPKKD